MTEADHIARTARHLAEVIDDLYRQHAAPRDHDRMIDLISVQVTRAIRLGIPIGEAREQRRSTCDAR